MSEVGRLQEGVVVLFEAESKRKKDNRRGYLEANR